MALINMNWEDDIEGMMGEIDPQATMNQNYIYGYTDATLLSTFAFGPLSALTMEYYMVVFAEDKLVLLEVSMGGKLTGNHAVIPHSEIESFKVKRGFLQYTLTIKLVGEKSPLKLKVARKMVNAERMGMGWQQRNLEHLANLDWNGLA